MRELYDTDYSGLMQSTLQKKLASYKSSEAYLRCQLFRYLWHKKIESVPEFVDGNNRYDLVVLKAGSPICIVEIKGAGTVRLDQIERYEQNSFGVPVFVLKGREDFLYVLNKITALF